MIEETEHDAYKFRTEIRFRASKKICMHFISSFVEILGRRIHDNCHRRDDVAEVVVDLIMDGRVNHVDRDEHGNFTIKGRQMRSCETSEIPLNPLLKDEILSPEFLRPDRLLGKLEKPKNKLLEALREIGDE